MTIIPVGTGWQIALWWWRWRRWCVIITRPRSIAGFIAATGRIIAEYFVGLTWLTCADPAVQTHLRTRATAPAISWQNQI
jgi:hypothetical protein